MGGRGALYSIEDIEREWGRCTATSKAELDIPEEDVGSHDPYRSTSFAAESRSTSIPSGR